jgi:nucleoside-diphosphate-sugar epimerase
MHNDRILITGACGQLGSELTLALRNIYGETNVIATDVATPKGEIADGIFEKLDILDSNQLAKLVGTYKVTQIYHLAAILSAAGEKNPKLAWKINMDGTFSVFDVAVEKKIQKVYFPSSIAVFGPNTPPHHTPQYTIMNPRTVYGISKLAGERWCKYYHDNYNLDVRSLRYPGLVSYKTPPGGGTTDYAVDIFYQAIEKQSYTCFLKEDTYLPMMYMPDAIKATLDLMHADADKIKLRGGYNLSGMSFCPSEVAAEIQKHIPEFKIDYVPDFRQKIADSWPQSIDDSKARADWGWKHSYDLPEMTTEMLENLRILKGVKEEVLI